jgi:hypothetical protein
VMQAQLLTTFFTILHYKQKSAKKVPGTIHFLDIT